MSKYPGLVQRLRGVNWVCHTYGKTEIKHDTVCHEAADAIELLVEEVTNLQEISVAEEVLANQIRKDIREDERERCAKIAERFLSNNEPVRLTASSIAAAIRERNNEHI